MKTEKLTMNTNPKPQPSRMGDLMKLRIASLAGLCLALAVGSASAQKTDSPRAWVNANLLAAEGTITWTHNGTAPPCDGPAVPGQKGPFVLGLGSTGTDTDNVCGQVQTSSWNVKAVFDKKKFITTFTNLDGSGKGSVGADGSLRKTPGSTSSSTTLKSWDVFLAGTDFGIKADGTKDDASIYSFLGGYTEAGGNQQFLINGSVVLKVDTLLSVTNGAHATIVSPTTNFFQGGLSLFASPGQLAGFSAEEINKQNPSQDLSWSVDFNGSSLTGSGINLGLFEKIPGGEFLPYADMPGTDITGTVAGGSTLEYDDTASYYEEAPGGATPEPSSLFLLGSGVLGLGGLLRKRMIT